MRTKYAAAEEIAVVAVGIVHESRSIALRHSLLDRVHEDEELDVLEGEERIEARAVVERSLCMQGVCQWRSRSRLM